jgi:hypothetical protein
MPNHKILFVMTLGFALVSSASGREWHDATGDFSLEAQFVSRHDGQVVLKRNDGRELSMSLKKLSDTDQKYVAELEVRDAPQAEELPGTPPAVVHIEKTSIQSPTTADEMSTTSAPAEKYTVRQVEMSPPASVITLPGPPVTLLWALHYENCYCNFRLSGANGFAHYSARHKEGPFFPTFTYDSNLAYQYSTKNFLYFNVVSGGEPAIRHWRFSTHPDCPCDCCDWCCDGCWDPCCCPWGHTVWYTTKEFPELCDWCLYGCTKFSIW